MRRRTPPSERPKLTVVDGGLSDEAAERAEARRLLGAGGGVTTAAVFEAELRRLEAVDGVPRAGLAGWWAEAVIDEEPYRVGVTASRADGYEWAMGFRGNHRRGGVEPTSSGAWQAGFEAVDAYRALLAELAAV